MRMPQQRRDRCAGLAEEIKGMGRDLSSHCGRIRKATRCVADLGDGPHQAAISKQIKGILQLLAEQCHNYDQLRSLMADVEIAEGVKNPVFYRGYDQETGVPMETCSKCVLKRGNR